MKRRHPSLDSPETRAKRAILREQNARYPETLAPMPKEQWPEGFGQTLSVETIAVWRSKHFLVQYVLEKTKCQSRLTVNRTSLNAKGESWEDGITWDELMEIKRQCGFADYWAIEIYPPTHQVVNVSNMRHLWLLDAAPAQAWIKKQQC